MKESDMMERERGGDKGRRVIRDSRRLKITCNSGVRIEVELRWENVVLLMEMQSLFCFQFLTHP